MVFEFSSEWRPECKHWPPIPSHHTPAVQPAARANVNMHSSGGLPVAATAAAPLAGAPRTESPKGKGEYLLGAQHQEPSKALPGWQRRRQRQIFIEARALSIRIVSTAAA